MKRHYFLGLNARRRHAWRHLVTFATRRDSRHLEEALGAKYGGIAVAAKNGRSALTIALKEYFRPGDGVIVNGFTCYAVYEAVKSAGLKPVFADINRDDLNFDIETLEDAINRGEGARGIIIQNTLGNPVNIEAVEKFAKKHNLVIIEDLAHCAGVKYTDGREVGTVGVATVLSFGKDKAIDAVSGGAVVFRGGLTASGGEATVSGDGVAAPRSEVAVPDGGVIAPEDKAGVGSRDAALLKMRCPASRLPKLSDRARARFYPLIAGAVRALSRIHLGGVLMRICLKFHWVEKSADNSLDLTRAIAPFEAKIALAQLEALSPRGEKPLRGFYLVRDRKKVLAELKTAGYHFDGFWYERPVSPERYYEKVHFDEGACPVATEVAKEIINFPTYYSKTDLAGARKIVEKYLVGGGKHGK